MDLKHHKTNAKIVARCNAAKRRNLRLKNIALKGRTRSRSEPALTISKENQEFHKTNLENLKKTHFAYHVTKKKPQMLRKYPNVTQISPNVAKNTEKVRNICNAQNIHNPIIKLKANDNLKVVATKRASMKSKHKQMIKPRNKQGFTEKIVSMWHYAKSFLGLSNSDRQNTQNCSVENKKSKHNLLINITPIKPKRSICVAKKPLIIHHNNKNSKEPKNSSIDQRYHRYENNIRKPKIIIDRNKIPIVLPVSKVNKINPNFGNDNKLKVNGIEQIDGLKQIVLKDKTKKDIVGTNTVRPLQHGNKSKVNVKADQKDYIESKKQIIKDKPKKTGTVEKNTNLPLKHENKTKVNISNEKEQAKKHIVLNDKPKKDVTIEKELIETKKEVVLNDKSKKDISIQLNTNYSLQHKNKSNAKIIMNEKEYIEVKQVLNAKLKKDTKIDTVSNQSLQYENKPVNVNANEKEQIEAEKQIVLKDKPKNDVIVEIHTNRSLSEILAKPNCYKSTSDDTNTTIIIEIKNATCNIIKDNKPIQPQNLNVNCAIGKLDVNKNGAENCEKNLLTLLNKCNVKPNNIKQITTHGCSKVPNNKVKKSTPKFTKTQHKLGKKNQPLVKEHKKYFKKSHQSLKRTHHHEDTKRRENLKRHICKHQHYRTKYRHKHGCKYHEINHINQRECSYSRGYISSDESRHSKQGKAHHDHHKNKYKHKERCRVCKKHVTCLYHHNKKNHKQNTHHHEKWTIRQKHYKEPKSSKKHPTPMKNRSFHNFQKKRRTLTVCTNSRRNSFKDKKLKRSVTYISKQRKSSTSKILPRYKYSKTNNTVPYSYLNYKRSNSLIFQTDSDSEPDRQEASKVLSWWYLHYALNAVQQNHIDEQLIKSDEIEENRPFLITYGDFCNVYDVVSKADIDSDDSSINENWNFPKHSNSLTDEESMVSESIYPNSSFYSSIHEQNIYDIDTNTSVESSLLDMSNNSAQKSTIALQNTDDE